MFVRKATTDTSVLLHRETVQKHGSHDQKTHGRKGGGGSGGSGSSGGGSMAPKIDNDKIRSVRRNLEDAEYQLSTFDASKPGGGQRYDGLSEDDQSIWDSATTEISRGSKLISQAKASTTEREYRSKLSEAAEKFDNAFQELNGAKHSRLLRARNSMESALEKVEALSSPEDATAQSLAWGARPRGMDFQEGSPGTIFGN